MPAIAASRCAPDCRPGGGRIRHGCAAALARPGARSAARPDSSPSVCRRFALRRWHRIALFLDGLAALAQSPRGAAATLVGWSTGNDAGTALRPPRRSPPHSRCRTRSLHALLIVTALDVAGTLPAHPRQPRRRERSCRRWRSQTRGIDDDARDRCRDRRPGAGDARLALGGLRSACSTWPAGAGPRGPWAVRAAAGGSSEDAVTAAGAARVLAWFQTRLGGTRERCVRVGAASAADSDSPPGSGV